MAMAAVIVPPLGRRKEAACSTTAPLEASMSTLSAVAWSEDGEGRNIGGWIEEV